MTSPIVRWMRRRDFTLISGLAGSLVIVLIIYAMFDFVQTARAKDEQVQTSTLNGELAQFILGTKEEDGSSMLENPDDYAAAKRAPRVVTVKKAVFSYLLNAQNVKTFKTEAISWEPPKSCVTEFCSTPKVGTKKAVNVRTCFYVSQQDYSGRFIYFSIAYPLAEVARHIRGSKAQDSSHLLLRLQGERATNLYLVFEAPTIAVARYPSQMRRFAGLHEVTAYLGDDFSRPSQLVNAQAFERRWQDSVNGEENYINIVGRMDSSLVFRSQDAVDLWPSTAIRKLSISVAASGKRTGPLPAEIFNIDAQTQGESLISLEQLYASRIRSRSLLELLAPPPVGGAEATGIWSSSSLGSPLEPRRLGFFQRASDLWADVLLRIFSKERSLVSVEQPLNARQSLIVRLKAEPGPLPDFATRAVTWLLIALLCVIGLGYIWVRTWSNLQAITRKAYRLTVAKTSEENLEEYKRSKDELGTLGRTFNLLLRRVRLTAKQRNERLRREQVLRAEKIRLEQVQVKARQAVLDAIGHEIKSPLESLLAKSAQEGLPADPNLERMRRAVEALYEATSVEAGLKSGDIVLKRSDLAAYLDKLAKNYSDRSLKVVYEGAINGVEAVFDAVELHVVIDHILNNAFRHRVPGSEVSVTLKYGPIGVVVEIFNHGPQIPTEDIERIFEFGITSQTASENRGQGLFIARLRMIAMHGLRI